MQTPSPEETRALIDTYEAEWRKEETALMSGITEILECGFYQNTIDIYPTPYHMGAFSDPVVIGMISRGKPLEPKHFTDTMTHEILHRLFSDNDKDIPFGAIWLRMFPDEEKLARIHIFIHAVHAHLYLNILKSPSRMEHNIKRHSIHPPYKQAWDIVAKQGHNTLIEELKKQYPQK